MKSILLLITSLLLSSIGFAQLTVTNDTYIYINGDGFDDTVVDTAPLFVRNEINLLNVNSELFLRNEAQIIQENNVKNSGLGKLSVYQEGTVNNYAYNYWCSPVGNVTTNTALNRDFTPNLNLYDVVDLTNSNLAGYTTTSYNGTSSPLNIESYWLWKYFPGATYADWVFVGQTGTVEPGYGFTMKGTIGSTLASGQRYDFRGKPNTGTITTAIEAGLETLIGNPFPSALDARAFIHDSGNAALLDSGTLYFWEQDQTVSSHNLAAYRGGYGAFTITSSGTLGSYVPPTFDSYYVDGSLNTVGSASTSGKEAKRFIPIGQGFMVRGATGIASGSTLTTQNSFRAFYKETGTNSEFYRTTSQESSSISTSNQMAYNEDGLQIIPNDYKRFRLNIDFSTSHTRQLLHNFHQTASPNFDYGLESKVYSTLNTDANWIQDNDAYVTKADNFQIDLSSPLNLILDQQHLIRFRIFDVQNFDNNQPIYIHDTENDTYVNLRVQDFEINLPVGDYSNRFHVVYQEANSLSNEEFSDEDFVVFQNNNENELVIKNPNSIPLKAVTLFDIGGKQIFNKLNLKNKARLSFSTKNLSDGVYVAKIETKNNSIISKKVVIKNK